MKKKFLVQDYTLNDIDQIAKKLINNFKSKTIIFNGSMGVGKTTLIKAIVNQLGSSDEVNSPTYSIINEYNSENGIIFHFDLYRIDDIEETFNFGIEDYLDTDNWCLIEWPEKIESILPNQYDVIDIKINENKKRTIKLNQKHTKTIC